MQKSFNSWPFLPHTNRLPEEQERWWAECFLPTQAIELLQNQPHWCIVTGSPGSGKTTLLTAFQQQRTESAFIVDYTPAWNIQTSQKGAILDGIFCLASQKLSRYLQQNPDLIDSRISDSQRQFLRWLIEKFNDPRAYTRWLDGLPPKYDTLMRTVKVEQDYYAEHNEKNVSGEIEELSNLIRRIGFDQVLIIMDMPSFLSEGQKTGIYNLLGWLEPMHHNNFALVISVDTNFFESANLPARTRGRAGIVAVDVSDEQTAEIIRHHLSAATEGKITSWEQIAGSRLIQKLREIVLKEFGEFSPGPMLQISSILIKLFYETGFTTIHDELFPEIRRDWYSKDLRLRLDKNSSLRGIWRGPKFISLDAGPYELLEKLWNAKTPVGNWGGKYTDYLHTLARRLRVEIEPDPSVPIYIKNRRGEGYFLECAEKGE